jgi:hypothetical protein
MSKFEYTDEMVARMQSLCANGVTEEVVESICTEFDFPRRSVTAKLRKLGYDVPKKPGAAPIFSPEETEALKQFLVAHSGKHTAEEIAANFGSGKFNARQINGKALSLEMTQHIKPAEKKAVPKSYTEAEETLVRKMVSEGAYLEDIAARLNKPVNSVRGKLLSMELKAPQRDKKAAKTDPYEGIEDMADKTVAEIAAHFGKTERGVRTVLTRRKMACADYQPKAE